MTHREDRRRRKAIAKAPSRALTGLMNVTARIETRQIAKNSTVDGGVAVDRMRSGKGNYAFDAAQCQYVDLVQAGIIDPTKVVRIALENAVSVVNLLLLAKATLTDEPEEKKEAAAPQESFA